MSDNQPHYNNDSNAPVPKVVAATVGAAAVTVIMVIISTATGWDIPPGLEGAVAVLITFIAGYLAPRR